MKDGVPKNKKKVSDERDSPAASIDQMVPIERVSVAEQVACSLLDLIRTGSVRAGQQLPTERELAATLQVSRPSVREAVRGLQIGRASCRERV